jgi:hypothetical protein
MTTLLRTAVFAFALTLTAALLAPPEVPAQSSPRFGTGLQLLGTTAGDNGNFGPGFRFRVSAPINRDLSFAIGTSFTGYIFEGQDEASYAVDPQASLVVTLPGRGSQSLYFLGGAGAYVPFGDTSADPGPTFHVGIGKVWLLQDTSLFLEFDPALLVGETQTDVLLPLRLGVIF